MGSKIQMCTCSIVFIYVLDFRKILGCYTGLGAVYKVPEALCLLIFIAAGSMKFVTRAGGSK